MNGSDLCSRILPSSSKLSSLFVMHQWFINAAMYSFSLSPSFTCLLLSVGRYLPNSYFISKKIINDNVFISNTHEGIELRDLSLTLKDYAIVHFLCKLRGIGWIRNLKSRGYVSQCIDVMYCFNSIQNLIPCSCFHMGGMVSDSESILAVNWLWLRLTHALRMFLFEAL